MRRMTLIFFFILILFGCSDLSEARQSKAAAVPKDGGTASSQKETGRSMPMSDINDIKPLEEPKLDLRLFYFMVPALLLLALILWFWFNRIRRGRRQQVLPVPLPPPDEEALALLDEIKNMEASQGKQFYFRLSAVTRNYIHRRFNIDAPEMTTEELLPRIDEMGLPADLGKGLRDLLVSRDPIKFAAVPAIAGQMQEDLAFVRRFVEKTTSLVKTRMLNDTGQNGEDSQSPNAQTVANAKP